MANMMALSIPLLMILILGTVVRATVPNVYQYQQQKTVTSILTATTSDNHRRRHHHLRQRRLENEGEGHSGSDTSGSDSTTAEGAGEGEGEQEDLTSILEADACNAATTDFFELVPAVADASDVYSATLMTTTSSNNGDGDDASVVGAGEDSDSNGFDYSDFQAKHNTTQVPDMSIGFPEDAETTYRQACEDNGGFWSSVEDSLFFCQLAGLSGDLASSAMTSVWVYRMGDCLATIDDCKKLDPVVLLEDTWVEMQLDCRLAQDGETLPPMEIDEDEIMDEIASDLSDEDLTCLSDTENFSDNSEGLVDASGEYAGTMEMKYSNDVQADVSSGSGGGTTIDYGQGEGGTNMTLTFPDDAVSTFKAACDSFGGYFSLVASQDFTCTSDGQSLNVKVSNMGECLANTAECQNMDPTNLLESIWGSLSLNCEVSTGDSNATGAGDETTPSTGGDDENLDGDGEDQADAPAPGDDTDGNEGDADQAGDEPGGADGSDSDGDGTEDQSETSVPGDTDNTGNEETTNSPGSSSEQSESEEVGMSDRDDECMQASMELIGNSQKLESAEAKYARQIETNDPTKIGYSSTAAQTMMTVCEEEGGFWSSVVSDEITCDMNGRTRRINVFNFGNCVAPTDECKAMDPIVLVKGFFWEVMKFRCWKSDDEGSSGSDSTSGGNEQPAPGPTSTPSPGPGPAPGETPHTGGNATHTGSGHHNTSGGQMPPPTLGGQQSSASTSPGSSDSSLPPYIPAAIALGALVLVIFGVIYWRRRSTGKEALPQRRAYEMTTVNDLQFDSLQFD